MKLIVLTLLLLSVVPDFTTMLECKTSAYLNQHMKWSFFSCSTFFSTREYCPCIFPQNFEWPGVLLCGITMLSPTYQKEFCYANVKVMMLHNYNHLANSGIKLVIQ